MPNYSDYIKGGEILIAPTLDDSVQYILKCTDCEEYYDLLQSLIDHSVVHYRKKANIEGWSTDGLNSDVYKNDEVNETEGVDPLNAIKWECDVECVSPTVKEEPISYTNLTEDESEYKADIHDETSQSSDDTSSEYMGTVPGPAKKFCTKIRSITSNFMKSKANVTAMISAYKKQPKLWNNNLPNVNTHERQQILQEIATELRKEVDIDLTCPQIVAVITHMKCTYKYQLKSTKKKKNDEKTWYIKQLNFLRPFMEDSSMAILDAVHPDLSREHLKEILDIYHRYHNLWNTSLIEHCCENKRVEALSGMLDDIKSEVGLKIDLNTLKEYVEAIHSCVSKEKQMEMDNSRTSQRSEYYKHMKFLYDHVGPFKCGECDRKFKTALTFKIHKSEHDGSPALSCSLCEKEFKTIASYATHARRHMEDLNLECKECGKRFLNIYALNTHMLCHTGAKPYCCEICGTSFRHIQSFNRHKMRHEKRYLHTCSLCSKGFILKSCLDDHMRSHNNIREFSCKICGKMFIRKKTLLQHSVTHYDARKHACELCGKTFKLKIGVTQHMKTHGSIVEDAS